MLRLASSFAINCGVPLFLLAGAVHTLWCAAAHRPCYRSTCALPPNAAGQIERVPVLIHPSNACGRCHEERGTRYDQALVTVFPP